MTIQSYKYIIGSTDDFNSIEELLKAYNEGTLGEGGGAVFSYDAPSGEIAGFKALDVAELIGYGMAFENDWCMDDTVSYLMVG
jgi:hypothetical protein